MINRPALLLLAGLLLAGCAKDAPPPAPGPAPVEYTTAIEVSVDGAAPYDLLEAQVVSSSYDNRQAALSVQGKLYGGRLLRLSFLQTLPTIGANTTDGLTASLDGAAAAQATGQSTRDAATNKVNGTFDATFAGNVRVSGRLRGLQLR